MKMKFILLIAFALIYSCSAFTIPNLVGTYVQCDFVSYDKTVLVIRDNLDFTSRIQYIGGGCGGNDIEYEIDATFTMDFTHQNTDGSYEVNQHYLTATAVPRTSKALLAFQDTCPDLLFFLEQPTDVFSCLFCGGNPQYDLLKVANDGGIYFGQGASCSAYPTALNPYEFTPVNPQYYGGVSTIAYYYSIITFDYPTVSNPTVPVPSYTEPDTTNLSTKDTNSIKTETIVRTYYTINPQSSSSFMLIPSIALIMSVMLMF